MANNMYYSILTTIGTEKLAQAIITEIPVKLTTIAVGDGNGQFYSPTPDQTRLKRETWRGDINDLRSAEDAANHVLAEGVVPADVGGWTAREVGLFDDAGDLIAVCNYPDTIKPLPTSGSGKQLYIQIILVVDNVAALELIIDGNIATASRHYVDEKDLKLRNDLAVNGSSMVGFNPFNYYPSATVGEYLAEIPGSDNTNTRDSTDKFNAAILKLALKGGGILSPEPGIYRINGSVLLPSNIILDLHGCTLSGSGSNTLIAAGAVVNGVLIDITGEYGTGDTGNGTHFVERAGIRGGVLKNAGLGIRGHRFNYGTSIEYVTFGSTLKQSWVTSHSWGLKVSMNTVSAPAIMKDFVDWTEVSGNNFEGNNVYSDGYIALTITTGGYGGSYTARIISNGFHRMYNAINITCECADMVIESNHFESVVKHIYGDNNRKETFSIKNNWMKANLLVSVPEITAITPMIFGFLINSEISYNRFTYQNRGPNFDYYINAPGANVYGNTIYIGYKADTNNDYSKYNVNEPNQLIVLRGSNNPDTSQPEMDIRSGSGNFTFEKYKASYRYVTNYIRGCTINYSGSTVSIKTWVPWNNGCRSICTFNLLVFGETRSILVTGRFCWKEVSFDVNKEIYGGSDILVGSLSGSTDGFTVLTFTGASAGGALNGWIKEV